MTRRWPVIGILLGKGHRSPGSTNVLRRQKVLSFTAGVQEETAEVTPAPAIDWVPSSRHPPLYSPDWSVAGNKCMPATRGLSRPVATSGIQSATRQGCKGCKGKGPLVRVSRRYSSRTDSQGDDISLEGGGLSGRSRYLGAPTAGLSAATSYEQTPQARHPSCRTPRQRRCGLHRVRCAP
jgi:hypothetical protein